jgi:hypothetical protein
VRLRLVIEVEDGPAAVVTPQVHGALLRFATGLGMLGRVPSGPTPLFAPDGREIGGAWIEEEHAPATEGAAGA